jgi:ketosteroid isomerase-like protein
MTAENGQFRLDSVARMQLSGVRAMCACANVIAKEYEMSAGKIAVRLALLSAAGCAAAATAAPGDTEQLIATDKRMQRAFVDRDIATLNQIFTDDYVLVVSNGGERTKPMILAEVASPDIRWDINETSGWNVKVHGDMAIVVATLHQKGVDHGTPFDSNVKFSDTYIREHGKWRNIHAHASRAVDIQAVELSHLTIG